MLSEIISEDREECPPTPTHLIKTLADRLIAAARTSNCAEECSEKWTWLQGLIAAAREARPRGTPSWAVAAVTILHLTERTLGLLPTGPSSLITHQEAVHRRRRQPYGTYSTPDPIVDRMCGQLDNAFRFSRGTPLAIADLSMEAGHYGLGLLSSSSKRTVCFYGVDRDPAAVVLARRLLGFAREARGGSDFDIVIRNQDSIITPLPRSWPSLFDAIIGNPPWKANHVTDASRLRSAFPEHLHGNFDVYLAFILRADALLKPGGYLSMLVPSAFLFNRSAQEVRETLLQRYRIVNLDVYPRRCFIELPQIAPVSFLMQKMGRPEKHRARTRVTYVQLEVGHPMRKHRTRSLAASKLWARLPGRVFHPLVRRDAIFLASLKSRATLKDYGMLLCGARLGNRSPSNPGEAFTGFHARHIRQFHACDRHVVQYSSGARRFDRKPALQYLHLSKICFQDLRCVTAPERLIAAAVGRGGLPVSTASMFVPHSAKHVDVFEALLNSSLANAWYKTSDVCRTIKLCVLSLLPIVHDSEAWERIAGLGRRIRAARGVHHRYLLECGHDGGAPELAKRFPRSTAALLDAKKELDETVFQLYGLTSRQRLAALRFSRARVF